MEEWQRRTKSHNAVRARTLRKLFSICGGRVRRVCPCELGRCTVCN
jgi:hypothetical protein